MSRPCSVGINPRPGRSGPLLRGHSGSGEHQTRGAVLCRAGCRVLLADPWRGCAAPGRSPGGAGGSAALVARVPSPGWEAGRPRCARTGPEASWLPPAPAQPGARPAECRAVRVSPQPVAARASAFQPAGFWPSSAVHVNAFLGRCSPEVLRTVCSQDSGFSGWWLPRMVGSQDSGSQDGGFSGPWLLRTVGSQDGGFSGRWLLRTVGSQDGELSCWKRKASAASEASCVPSPEGRGRHGCPLPGRWLRPSLQGVEGRLETGRRLVFCVTQGSVRGAGPCGQHWAARRWHLPHTPRGAWRWLGADAGSPVPLQRFASCSRT